MKNMMPLRGFINRVKKGILGDDFFASVLYLSILAVTTVVTWYTGILWIAVGVYAVALILVALTQKSMAGLLPIAATFVLNYSVRQRDVLADIKAPIILAVAFIAFVAVMCIVWFVKNRKEVTFGYFPKLPYILLFFSLLLGGVGAGFWFTPQWFGGIAIGAVCLIALLIFTSSNRKPLDKEFLCRILLTVGIIVVAQTFLYYYKAHLAGNLDDAIVKKTLDYGWNMSNGGGMLIIMAIPVLFYYSTKRKFPIVEAVLFIVFVFALIMTSSRGAQVSSAVFILPTILYALIKAKSKPGYVAAILVSAVLAAGMVLLMLESDSGFIERWMKIGFSDSGRFNIYKECIEEALSGNFLFGWGFFHSIPGVTWNNFLAHNTILQFWADFGLLGLVTLAALFIGNYRVVLRKNGTWGVMMALALLAPGIHGMLDVNYFTPYYMPILMVFVAIASNVTEFRVKGEKEAAEKAAAEAVKVFAARAENEKKEAEFPHIEYN